MSVNATDYQEFDNRHAAITKLMSEISSQIEAASKSFSQGMADAQGRWANADMEDWALLNQQIKVEMENTRKRKQTYWFYICCIENVLQ